MAGVFIVPAHLLSAKVDADYLRQKTAATQSIVSEHELSLSGVATLIMRWLATPDQDSEWHIQHCVTFYESIASVFVIMKDETRVHSPLEWW
ncbi:unnamed protein product [Timema podura]|uniref:Uncharacterized protein n=1 Tax=Timema podura TaxID=61482 RepID=A0ABN7P0E3_TIMPD|nr:unnamed protein product [Timema podura]